MAFVAASILPFSSCSDFLDREPITKPEAGNFLTGAIQVENYINGLYMTLPSFSKFGLGVRSEEKNSDNIIAEKYDARLHGQNNQFSGASDWQTGYQNLRKVNYFFHNYKVPEAQENEDVLSLKGEAYFLRAYWHFDLLKKFGSIPVMDAFWDENATIAGLQIPAKTRNEVARFILSDLVEAKNLLHSRGKYSGIRINKEAAMVLAMNVALYEGTWEKYHSSDDFASSTNESNYFLGEVINWGNELFGCGIDLYKTGQNPGDAFAALFNSKDLSGMGEVLLWRKYSSDEGVFHDVNGNLKAGVVDSEGAAGITQSLVDNYLSNLKIHFRKEAGADEIVDDIERRISELFAEKLSAGSQVITIADVEEVIARMGKPEDMEAEGESASADSGSTSAGGGYGAGAWNSNTAYGTTRRRLYRNPDDKMLGGVISGMAAYLGWDVTLLRLLLLVILICGVGTLIPVYIVCWLVIPEARTAAEKLSMRGEAVTVENIGKTVTDGFEKVANGVNDYMRSDKPRTFLQKLGDALVMIVGWFLKICLVIFAIICSPVLFVFGVVFVALLFAAIAVAVGGGAALISLFPMADVVLPTSPLSAIVMYIAGILLVGIPLVSLVWAIFSQIFKWQPMNSGLKWTLVILWIVSAACFGICFAVQGATFPELGIFNF